MTPTPTTMTEAPVGWQAQFDDGNWSQALYSETEVKEFKASPRGTVSAYRPLYAAAPPAPAPDDLRELREAAERATPGPWRRYHEAQVIRPDGGRVCKAHFERDTTFIARANPSTVLSLIARISRLESENARLRETVGFYADENNWWTEESVNTQELFGTPMGDDLGRRARAAVSEIKP
mgnify:CR=1 FL=1